MGEIRDIDENTLPTYEDVLIFHEWTRQKTVIQRKTRREPTFMEFAEKVTAKVEDIYGEELRFLSFRMEELWKCFGATTSSTKTRATHTRTSLQSVWKSSRGTVKYCLTFVPASVQILKNAAAHRNRKFLNVSKIF